jgi:hypothetical protein
LYASHFVREGGSLIYQAYKMRATFFLHLDLFCFGLAWCKIKGKIAALPGENFWWILIHGNGWKEICFEQNKMRQAFLDRRHLEEGRLENLKRTGPILSVWPWGFGTQFDGNNRKLSRNGRSLDVPANCRTNGMNAGEWTTFWIGIRIDEEKPFANWSKATPRLILPREFALEFVSVWKNVEELCIEERLRIGRSPSLCTIYGQKHFWGKGIGRQLWQIEGKWMNELTWRE